MTAAEQCGQAVLVWSQVSRHRPQNTFWQHIVTFGCQATPLHNGHSNIAVLPSVLHSWLRFIFSTWSAAWADAAGGSA
eukprot:3726531-Pyramimonas_sp.AAC.1